MPSMTVSVWWSDHEQMGGESVPRSGDKQSSGKPQKETDITECHVPAPSQVSTIQNIGRRGGRQYRLTVGVVQPGRISKSKLM